MPSEPYGHRGNPSWYERKRAKVVGERLGAMVEALVQQGFVEDEAVTFITGVAVERAARHGDENWSTPINALRTVQHLLNGGFAKEWSIDAISLALTDIGAIMREQEPLLDPAL